MNQQEQATKSAAIFQDTINGTNDPTPWPVSMWASSGDTIWTAGTARTAGEDSVGMIYGPGDTIVHRNTIAGDTTRATESFALRPSDGQSPMDAMLAGIEQWNHRHPDRWDTVATPGQYRMTDPTTGRPLPMCVCSIESGPCERVDVFHVSGRFWSTSACGEKRTPARPAWTSFPS